MSEEADAYITSLIALYERLRDEGGDAAIGLDPIESSRARLVMAILDAAYPVPREITEVEHSVRETMGTLLDRPEVCAVAAIFNVQRRPLSAAGSSRGISGDDMANGGTSARSATDPQWQAPSI